MIERDFVCDILIGKGIVWGFFVVILWDWLVKEIMWMEELFMWYC